jgi:hypothetical protein
MISAALAEGIEAARASYKLGFYLADKERDGKFHRLSVITDQPGMAKGGQCGSAAPRTNAGSRRRSNAA